MMNNHLHESVLVNTYPLTSSSPSERYQHHDMNECLDNETSIADVLSETDLPIQIKPKTTSSQACQAWDKADFIDPNVQIATYAYDDVSHTIGTLESQLQKQSRDHTVTVSPIIRYVAALKDLRKKSQSIASFHDEIAFTHVVKQKLQDLSATLGLADDHFNIDTSGEPLLIKEGHGEHMISPTHFENGAYLSHPHPDHQLDMDAHDIPRIKIGKYVRFGRNAAVNAGGNITIGNGVWLSPGSCLLRQDHDPYGRPSIASRTVAMTRQPPITLADYAWVGREAMVGWDADYIGKCAIVATRSFLNTWVGDYAITGAHGKIIQYMPYKAAIMEAMQLSLEEILQISDWEKINHHWLSMYAHRNHSTMQPLCTISDKLKDLLASLPSKRSKVLDIHPGHGELLTLAASKNVFADAVFVPKDAIAYILQNVQNTGNYTIRLRTADVDESGFTLPLQDALTNPFTHKSSGYDLVVNSHIIEPMSDKLLSQLGESARVSNTGGKIFFSTTAFYDYHELIAHAQHLSLSLLAYGIDEQTHQHYIIFQKN